MKSTHDGPQDAADGARAIEVRHLRLVRAIDSEGSVTRAAGRLHLTQSALSHQLLDLERTLGTRLFDRVGKRMVPTPAGAKVIAAGERLLGELAALERELHDMQSGAALPLRVTTSCYASYQWLPEALMRFGATHPRIEITIVLEATRRAQEALANDEVDLAIMSEPPREETWAVEPLVTSELVALASPQHPLVAGQKRRDSLRWGALRGATILVHDISDRLSERLESAVRDSFEREHGERLAKPIHLRRIPLTEALIELARAGRGVVIADRWIVSSFIDARLVALPLVPCASRTFHAVWRKSNPRGLPIRELVKVIEGSASCVQEQRAVRGRARTRGTAAE